MKAHVVDLATYRRTGKIVERIPVQYSDEFVSHARNIELMFEAMARAMSGERPSDTEQETA